MPITIGRFCLLVVLHLQDIEGDLSIFAIEQKQNRMDPGTKSNEISYLVRNLRENQFPRIMVTSALLTFSNFCLASLITFMSSSFLVFANDLVNVLGLPSPLVLCFELMLRRASGLNLEH